MGGTHLPLTLPAFQFQLPFMLISIFISFHFVFLHFFFLHPVALKLLLSQVSSLHGTEDVLESGPFQLHSLMFFVLLSLVLFFSFQKLLLGL